MASLAAVNSFSGLKVQSLKVSGARSASTSRPTTVVCSAGNPWEKVGKALVATGAGLLIATSANAATVKLGSSGGALVFEPSVITIKAGDTVDFTNNAGFPHNVVFDPDAVPATVDADAISQSDLLNAPGEVYSVKLDVKGTYRVYCEPHEGAGMEGIITVE
jgi:plastocyanin